MPILTWHILCFKMLSGIYIHIWNLPLTQYYELAVTHPHHRWLWISYILTGVSLPLLLQWLILHIRKKTNKLVIKEPKNGY